MSRGDSSWFVLELYGCFFPLKKKRILIDLEINGDKVIVLIEDMVFDKIITGAPIGLEVLRDEFKKT